MNKVLVTGSSGFLGKIIIKHLGQKCEIRTLSSSTGFYKMKLDEEIPFFDYNFDYNSDYNSDYN